MKKETGKDACHLSRRGVVLSRKTCNLILYQSKVKLHCHGSPNPVLKRFFSGMAFSKVVRVVCQSRSRFVKALGEHGKFESLFVTCCYCDFFPAD